MTKVFKCNNCDQYFKKLFENHCPNCGSENIWIKTEIQEELTPSQVALVDKINNIAYRCMLELLGKTEKELPWDMEWIGELSDDLATHAIRFHGKTEMEVYPYIEENSEKLLRSLTDPDLAYEKQKEAENENI